MMRAIAALKISISIMFMISFASFDGECAVRDLKRPVRETKKSTAVKSTAVKSTAGEAAAVKTSKVKYVRSPYGLQALMQLVNDRKEMIKVLNQETLNYNNAVKAVNQKTIKTGEDASLVKNKVGEPVVKLDNRNTGGSEWVYKPGNEGFDSKNKLYFIFDANGRFVSWQAPQK